MATNQDKVKELIDLRNQAKLGGGEKRIESQHKRVNIQPGKESPCCWTKTASKNSICSSHTGVIISAWKRQNSSETELLPDKERSTDVSYLYLHRILPYSEEHFQKCWLRRSASHGQSDDGRSSDHRTERSGGARIQKA